MTTKEDIRRLLSKGLTGKEAGRLVLQDNWLVDHGRDGFLTQKDVNTIKSRLKTTYDIQEYNSYIQTYRLLDYTLKEARIAELQATNMIRTLTMYLLLAVMKLMDQNHDAILRPTIMTEKQYQDVKAEQRARFMDSLYDLTEIILWRVGEKDPKYLKEEEDSYITEPDLEYLVEEEPDKLREAILDIIQLLKTDKIQPVSLAEKYVKKLKDLGTERQTIMDSLDYEEDQAGLDQILTKGRVLTDTEMEDLDKLDKEEDRLKMEAYKAGKRDQEKLISTLQELIDGSVKTEQAEAILKAFYTTGEELYKAGLPEHISWIDTFKTSFYGGDGTLGGIAIIQNPKSHDLDDRGYYKDDQARARYFKNQTLTAEAVATGYSFIVENIKLFLAFHSMIEAVSEVIGIDFTEDTRIWMEGLFSAVDYYNSVVQQSRYYSLPQKTGQDIKTIDISRYKPSAKTIKYLRDRMAISLGEGWHEAKDALLADMEERSSVTDLSRNLGRSTGRHGGEGGYG